MSEIIRWDQSGAAYTTAAIQTGPLLPVDGYQAVVKSQIVGIVGVDHSPATIKGRDIEEYLHYGVVEELGETYETDTAAYDRGAALRRPQWEDRLPATDQRVILHAKEFGDLSWYVANLLTARRMWLTRAIGVPGFTTLHQFDQVALGWAASHADIFTDPAAFYFNAGDEFIDRSLQLLKRPNPQAAVQFSRVAGRLMVATAAILQLRLDTNWSTVAIDNLAKVEARHAKGNIFGNGDSR